MKTKITIEAEGKDTEETKFQFGNVVVVDKDKIGVIVKSWESYFGYSHEVYVRSYNRTGSYEEKNIKHFVYSNNLSEEEKELY